MPIRYDKREIVYSPDVISEQSLRRRRGITDFYSTAALKHPTQEDYNRIGSKRVIWKQTSRLTKIAQEHLGSYEYWWVIAWWNKKPTEAHFKHGDVVYVPNDLNLTLEVLGV